MKTEQVVSHTPGPWKYHLGRGANPRFHIQTTAGYQITSTPELENGPIHYTESQSKEANARLIAAAPDLLEALGEMLRDVRENFSRNNMGEPAGPTISKAAAAIAKANGRKDD